MSADGRGRSRDRCRRALSKPVLHVELVVLARHAAGALPAPGAAVVTVARHRRLGRAGRRRAARARAGRCPQLATRVATTGSWSAVRAGPVKTRHLRVDGEHRHLVGVGRREPAAPAGGRHARGVRHGEPGRVPSRSAHRARRAIAVARPSRSSGLIANCADPPAVAVRALVVERCRSGARAARSPTATRSSSRLAGEHHVLGHRLGARSRGAGALRVGVAGGVAGERRRSPVAGVALGRACRRRRVQGQDLAAAPGHSAAVRISVRSPLRASSNVPSERKSSTAGPVSTSRWARWLVEPGVQRVGPLDAAAGRAAAGAVVPLAEPQLVAGAAVAAGEPFHRRDPGGVVVDAVDEEDRDVRARWRPSASRAPACQAE